MSKNIPIVMSTDKNFILQTRVAIWSILKSNNNMTDIKIIILCDKELQNIYRNKIYEIKTFWKNIDIEFLEIDYNIFARAKPIAHIPISGFYRLIVGKLLNVEKCLYLDGDIIVNANISQLYSIDIGDNYVAGVRDNNILCNIKKYENHAQIIDIPSLRGYINSGVLIFNVLKIREDGLTEKFLSLLEKEYPWPDQDIINKVCNGKIKYLDLGYNLFNRYYENKEILENSDFSREEIDNANENFMILHFAGKQKPWNYNRIKGSRIWWKYAKEALDRDDYEYLYKNAIEQTRKSDWDFILEKCENEENIIIFGYTPIGKEVLNSLIRCGITNIVCFCDNSLEKQQFSYRNLKVCSPVQASQIYSDALWINTSQNYSTEISNQLKSIGVDGCRIVLYYHKTEDFYNRVDKRYIKYEQDLLELRQYGFDRKKLVFAEKMNYLEDK